MKKFNFSVVFILLFAFLLHAQTPKKIPSTAETPQKFGVVVERFVNDFQVNADGTSVEIFDRLERLETANAVEYEKKFEHIFNGNLQTSEVLDAYLLKKNGRKIQVQKENIQTKPTPQAEAAPSFSSLKMIEVNYGDVEIGDAVYIRLKNTETRPMFGSHFNKLNILPAIFEWKSAVVTLTAPKDYPIYFQAENFKGGKQSDDGETVSWKWIASDIQALSYEAGMYDFIRQSPRLAITSFENYDELGATYWAEAKEKAAVTPTVQKLADELTKDINEPQKQAYAIYEWVNKNVRYLSIVLERGGWIPHSADEILKNRYADCKDYTTVLHALLKAKNIESYPVLIRSDLTDWFPTVAVPYFFNHEILYIPSLDMFADATAPNTRLGILPQILAGKNALLAGSKTGVVKLPADNPESNQISSKTRIDFSENGGLKAVSKNTYHGKTEIIFRPMFASSYLQKNSGDFVRYMLAYYSINGTGKIVNLGNPFSVGEPFTVEIEANVEDHTTFMPTGNFSLPIGLNFVNVAALEAYIKTESRKTDILMGATRIYEEFDLHFPESVSIENLPPKIEFENSVGFYRSNFIKQENAVNVVRELIVKKDVIKPENYAALRELINKAINALNSEISYRADPKLVRMRSRDLKRNPKKNTIAPSVEQLLEEKYAIEAKPLTARELKNLEAALKKNPEDTETRRRLLRGYYNHADKLTAARKNAAVAHRLWFIENRPEMEKSDIFGFITLYDDAAEQDYQILKTAWLKQIEANPKNMLIRLNAVEFFDYAEPEIAEKLLLEGQKLDPANYEFPLLLTDLHHHTINFSGENLNAEQIKQHRQKAFDAGETALILLKKERSDERIGKRGELLLKLTKTAYELEKFERAESLALELILDFGQSTDYPNYDNATHIGNIVLGLLALRKNDVAKAKEHLLIAIRAPLRQEGNYLTEIDTGLAQKLFEKGEKEAVLEYLKLCENLNHFKEYADLYADETQALKKWQQEIKNNKTPSFNFDAP